MGNRNYCIYCKGEQEYIDKKVKEIHVIKDAEYEFEVTRPICKKCGEDLGLPNYIDFNNEEISKQYREAEGLVQISEINDLIELYNLGKSTLPIVLGFGEITITRYLLGQIPSKEYSEIIKNALASPAFMQEAIERNKDNLTKAAYEKASVAAKELVNLFGMSSKMIGAIGFLFEYLDEISPMALQKLLYYSDGIYAAKFKKSLFEDTCEAWAHGPVYHSTYRMVKQLTSDVKKDARFSIIKNNIDELTAEEKDVIKMVADSFGKYSAITLSKITHEENPWKDTRAGLNDGEWSNELIEKKRMQSYFSKVDKKFHISQEGLNKYIDYILKMKRI